MLGLFCFAAASPAYIANTLDRLLTTALLRLEILRVEHRKHLSAARGAVAIEFQIRNCHFKRRPDETIY